MSDLFDVNLARASIETMSRRAGERLLGFAEAVRQLILLAPVKHLDETGFRIVKTLKWLHIAATGWLTYYRIGADRGDMLSGVSGIVVHDYWQSYFTMPSVEHALCNVHHLRELQALSKIEQEDWSRRMQTLLRRACHAGHLSRDKKQAPDQRLIDLISRRYDAIVATGLTFHQGLPALPQKLRRDGTPRAGRPRRRVGHNLVVRLGDHKEAVLRFLINPEVPFTNNQAGTRRPDDETPAENLRLLPIGPPRKRFHGDPNAYRNRQKTGMGYHPKPHARPQRPDQQPQSRLSHTA
jgi:transposase